MTDNTPKLCPHCGQNLPNSTSALNMDLADDMRLAGDVLSCSTWNISDQEEPTAPAVPSVSTQDDGREYDHRGIRMPRRTRVGGIITPQ